MKRFTLFLFATLAAFPALALDLAEARSRGFVCEQADGKLAAKGGGAEAVRLVAEINAKRTAEYAKISKQNQQSIEVVGQLAHPQILKQPGAKACQ